MNERLNDFLRRNLENSKKARVQKHRSQNVRPPKVVLDPPDFIKNDGAYGNCNSSAGIANRKVESDIRNSKLLNMYFSDNIKNSQRPNKLKLNMKKISSAGMMKNKYTRVKGQPTDPKKMNNWIANAKLHYGTKKSNSTDRRPFTDVQEFRKYDTIQKRAIISHSQERSYMDTKKLSKLFRKAGAGRFSQSSHMGNNEISGQLYSWGTSKEGVLGHEINDDEDSDLKIDSNGAMICKAPKLIDYFTKYAIRISKMSCGAGHIIVIADNLKIYSWGCNRMGQLGLNLKQESISTPHEVSDLRCKGIIDVY